MHYTKLSQRPPDWFLILTVAHVKVHLTYPLQGAWTKSFCAFSRVILLFRETPNPKQNLSPSFEALNPKPETPILGSKF